MKITENIINSFISFRKNQGLKEKTLYCYRYNFTAFFHWLKENKKDKIEDIDKLTIEDYKGYLFSLEGSKKSRYGKQENLSSGTINQKLVAVKKFLEFTNYTFDIGMDYTKVRMNKVNYRTGDYATLEEIKLMLKATEKTEKYRLNQLRFKLLILVCYVSGARLNEMRQVKIEDIENGKCKIMGKNSKERWIFFNEECKQVLHEYLEESKKEIPRLQQKIERKNNYAICSHGYDTFGEQIGKQVITEMFKRLNKELKRDKHITCHSLRHSFATTMVDNGTNPMHLKELMGHEKLNTTAGYYHRNWNILEIQQHKVFAGLCL